MYSVSLLQVYGLLARFCCRVVPGVQPPGRLYGTTHTLMSSDIIFEMSDRTLLLASSIKYLLFKEPNQHTVGEE